MSVNWPNLIQKWEKKVGCNACLSSFPALAQQVCQKENFTEDDCLKVADAILSSSLEGKDLQAALSERLPPDKVQRVMAQVKAAPPVFQAGQGPVNLVASSP